MNTLLMKNTDWEAIMKLGFVETNDGSEDPRGIFRDIKKNGFHLYIDPWMDVFLSHNESDPIQLTINSLFDLQSAIDLISGGIDEDGMIDGITDWVEFSRQKPEAGRQIWIVWPSGNYQPEIRRLSQEELQKDWGDMRWLPVPPYQ